MIKLLSMFSDHNCCQPLTAGITLMAGRAQLKREIQFPETVEVFQGGPSKSYHALETDLLVPARRDLLQEVGDALPFGAAEAQGLKKVLHLPDRAVVDDVACVMLLAIINFAGTSGSYA